MEMPSSRCRTPYRPEVFEIIVDRLARSSERSRSLTSVALAPSKRPPSRPNHSRISIRGSRDVA